MTATPRPYGEVMTDAVRALTEAARLTRPVLERTGTEGAWTWTPGPRQERVDWAEFVANAVTAAAANVGGVDVALAGRPGSWESDKVGDLITSTAGYELADLLRYRTEPIRVVLHVDELAYETTCDGDDPLDQAESAIATFVTPDDGDDLAHDALSAAEQLLEQGKRTVYATWAASLEQAVRDVAAELVGRPAADDVTVTVDLDTWRPYDQRPDDAGLGQQLLERALARTPWPAADAKAAADAALALLPSSPVRS